MDSSTQQKLGIGMGLGLFLLSLVYCLTDIGTILDKSLFTGQYTSAIKYALAFFFGFVSIAFKILLVLLFVFIFIVVYNIAAVAIFKPLMSESLDSGTAFKGFTGAREIIEQARVSYFSMIKTVAINTMRVVFGFINVPHTILLFFVVIPIYLLFAVFAYYQFVSTKSTTTDSNDVQKGQKIMNTNYHYFIMLIFTIIITFGIYLTYKTLAILTNKTG